jgi:hypothetical protein
MEARGRCTSVWIHVVLEELLQDYRPQGHGTWRNHFADVVLTEARETTHLPHVAGRSSDCIPEGAPRQPFWRWPSHAMMAELPVMTELLPCPSEGLYVEGSAIDRALGFTCQLSRSIPGEDRALRGIEAAMAVILAMSFVDRNHVVTGGGNRAGAS